MPVAAHTPHKFLVPHLAASPCSSRARAGLETAVSSTFMGNEPSRPTKSHVPSWKGCGSGAGLPSPRRVRHSRPLGNCSFQFLCGTRWTHRAEPSAWGLVPAPHQPPSQAAAGGCRSPAGDRRGQGSWSSRDRLPRQLQTVRRERVSSPGTGPAVTFPAARRRVTENQCKQPCLLPRKSQG